MNIVDFHTHIFPDAIAERTISMLSEKTQIKAYSNGTLDGLRRQMQTSGVALSVILPVITRAKQFDSILKFAVETNEHYDDLLSFGAVFPGDEDYKAKLRLMKEYGIKGIKIHPNYHAIDFNDKRTMNLVYLACEEDMIISVHAGKDVGIPEVINNTPDMIVDVLDQIRPKKLVLAHAGAWGMWDEVEAKICGRDVYMDLAYTTDNIDTAQLKRIIESHGSDKVLFATDLPWSGQKESIEFLKSLELGDEAENRILSSNAYTLLGVGE